LERGLIASIKILKRKTNPTARSQENAAPRGSEVRTDARSTQEGAPPTKKTTQKADLYPTMRLEKIEWQKTSLHIGTEEGATGPGERKKRGRQPSHKPRAQKLTTLKRKKKKRTRQAGNSFTKRNHPEFSQSNFPVGYHPHCVTAKFSGGPGFLHMNK